MSLESLAQFIRDHKFKLLLAMLLVFHTVVALLLYNVIPQKCIETTTKSIEITKYIEEIFTRPRCLLDDSVVVKTNTNPVASADDQSIAIFSGYLQVNNPRELSAWYDVFLTNQKLVKKYLPFELLSIQWYNHIVNETLSISDKKEVRYMILTTDCSRIDFKFVQNEELKKWQLERAATLTFHYKPTPSSEHRLIQCNFGKPGTDFEHAYYKHYKCQESSRYKCKIVGDYPDEEKMKFYLWIDNFEFELSGETYEIRSRHRFSKPYTECQVD